MNTYELNDGQLFEDGKFLCNVADKHKTLESALAWYFTPILKHEYIDYEQQELDTLQSDY